MNVYLLVLLRTVSLMIFLLITTLFLMGKRPIGEMPVFDFLTVIVLGSVVGADVADPNIEHLPTVFAVLVLAVLEHVIGKLSIKYRSIGRLISFEPTIVIQNGKLIQKNLNKINYSIDEILMILRQQGIFDLKHVAYGIIESSGKLSVLKPTANQTVTLNDLSMKGHPPELYFPIIMDGKIDQRGLEKIGYDESQLHHALSNAGYPQVEQIFYAAISDMGNIHISPYNHQENLANIAH